MTQLHFGALSGAALASAAGLETDVLMIRCIAVVSPALTLHSAHADSGERTRARSDRRERRVSSRGVGTSGEAAGART